MRGDPRYDRCTENKGPRTLWSKSSIREVTNDCLEDLIRWAIRNGGSIETPEIRYAIQVHEERTGRYMSW